MKFFSEKGPPMRGKPTGKERSVAKEEWIFPKNIEKIINFNIFRWKIDEAKKSKSGRIVFGKLELTILDTLHWMGREFESLSKKSFIQIAELMHAEFSKAMQKKRNVQNKKNKNKKTKKDL